MPQIEMDSVDKTYPAHRTLFGRARLQERQGYTALTALSFAIERGETVGYIGVNGSGKSTTVKLLTGILAPTQGHIHVLGRDPFQYREQNAQAIGVVFGQRTQLWWDLPLTDSLKLTQQMYRISRAKYDFWIEQLSATLDLGELLHKPVRSMSLGQKMRAEIIATLIHEPEIAFLDEPTIGLDLLAKEQIRAAITTLNQETGMTLFLTSHDLGDIQSLCQRVIILDQGRKVHDGAVGDLLGTLGQVRYLNVFTADTVAVTLLDGVQEITGSAGERAFNWNGSQWSAAQVIGHLGSQLRIDDFTLRETSLEDIVRTLYRSYQGQGQPA